MVIRLALGLDTVRVLSVNIVGLEIKTKLVEEISWSILVHWCWSHKYVVDNLLCVLIMLCFKMELKTQ